MKTKKVYLVDTLKRTTEEFTFNASMSEFEINKVFMGMTGERYFKIFIKRYRVLNELLSKYKNYKKIKKDDPLYD